MGGEEVLQGVKQTGLFSKTGVLGRARIWVQFFSAKCGLACDRAAGTEGRVLYRGIHRGPRRENQATLGEWSTLHMHTEWTWGHDPTVMWRLGDNRSEIYHPVTRDIQETNTWEPQKIDVSKLEASKSVHSKKQSRPAHNTISLLNDPKASWQSQEVFT